MERETIKQMIRTDLELGMTLTVISGLKNYRTIDLRKYISDLKKDGVNISDRWVLKNKKKYKEYFISKKYDFSKTKFR